MLKCLLYVGLQPLLIQAYIEYTYMDQYILLHNSVRARSVWLVRIPINASQEFGAPSP